ncbi:uncharacterized protein FYW49_008711 [Xenentodon cancila]
MASTEDETLLFLIYQHLKLNGYNKAAQVLEKHVTQVETPEESSNLHDIYTGWMKLCSLAKQEMDDSGNVKKKTIKPEPSTSEEEETSDTRLSKGTGEDGEDDKPPLEYKTDVSESSHAGSNAETVSEQQLDAVEKTQTTEMNSVKSDSSDSEAEEETIKEEQTNTEQEPASAEASVEVSNEDKSCSLEAPDSSEKPEPSQGDSSSPVDATQPDRAEDQPQAPNPDEASSSDSEQEDGADEMKQCACPPSSSTPL